MSDHTNTPEGTMTTEQIAELNSRAAAIVAMRTTEQLISDFEATEDDTLPQKDADDRLALAKVRGWIMDALEARDLAAFEAWFDGDIDGSPRKYFL